MELMTPHNVMWPNPEAESVMGRQQLLHRSMNSPNFVEPKDSFPCSQQTAVVSILRKTRPSYTPLLCSLYIHFNIIFFLHLGFLFILFPSVCPTEILYECPTSPTHATCSGQLIFQYLITLTASRETKQLWRSSCILLNLQLFSLLYV
jgi:hypothetical protein